MSSRRALLLLSCGAAVVFAAVGGAYRSYTRYAEKAANGEQIYDEGHWPADLKGTRESFKSKDDLNDVQVWELAWFNFIWRARVSPNVLTKWQQECGAVLIPEASVPLQFWKMPAPWWQPQAGDGAQFFMTPGFSPYSQADDNLACAGLYDPDTQTLYGWSQFDF